MVVFQVIEPGFLTTVQDLGRWGFQQYGVPVSGAMDLYALRLGNRLVGNHDCAAGLEVTITGPTLRILEQTLIAITGGDITPQLNGQPFPMWETVAVERGDYLTFAGLRRGCRAYITVAGGIDVPVVMGSRSTYLRGRLGGLDGRLLKTEDYLETVGSAARQIAPGTQVPAALLPAYRAHIEARVILGPQMDFFPSESVGAFLSETYKLTDQADRMGYRLEGAKIKHADQADIISDGIAPGSVQIPGDGLPIIMLADRQTIGGYTKIATVISSDLGKLAQAKPGDTICFHGISLDEAHSILGDMEQALLRWQQSLDGACLPECGSKKYQMSINGQQFHVEIKEVGI